jgi:hypothetical protein
MTIPTSWTDNGLTWDAPNPLWTLQELNLAMIEAIKEKDSATGRTVPALLSASYNPIRPNRDYVNAIHSEVSTLIPLFVNHTDHGGDWSGQATIPAWTEATILTAIGDSARIISSNLNVLSPWYFQTKRILDLLRWVKKLAPYSANNRAYREGYIPPYGDQSTADIAWNTALTQYNINAWQLGGFDDNNGIGRYSDIWLNRSYFMPYMLNSRGSFNFNYNISGVFASLDLYTIAMINTNINYENHNAIFVFDDTCGYMENVNTKIESFTERDISASFDSSVIEFTTPIRPDRIAIDYTVQNLSIYLTSGTVILKFDGLNGFKFKNC